jgi:hypothetical protein
MSNCKRNHDDPLLQLLLREYHLNMLRMPQEGLKVGEVLIEQEKGLPTIRCELTDIFTGTRPILAGPPDKMIQKLENQSSGKLSASAGFSFLEKLLQFIPNALAKVKGAYSDAESATISLKMLTRETISFANLGQFLNVAALRKDQGLYHDGNTLFVITSIVRSTGVELRTTDNAGRAVEAKLGATHFGEGNAQIKAESKGGGRMVYTGKKPLAIGVELFRIEVAGGSFRLKATNEAVAVRGGGMETTEDDFAWIGDKDNGDAFIDMLGAHA